MKTQIRDATVKLSLKDSFFFFFQMISQGQTDLILEAKSQATNL